MIVIKRVKLGPVAASTRSNDPNDQSMLRSLLVDRYGDLKVRLTRRLGSSDWAEEALQDTYLKLDGANENGLVRNPMAYLFRAAFNTALNQRRSQGRKLSDDEIAAMLDVPDDAPGPEQILESRSDVDALKRVLAGLPPRARQILLAARLDGWPRQQIAEHFGISVSLVEKELRWAQEYCVVQFKKGGRN